jgi:hypothetical protein
MVRNHLRSLPWLAMGCGKRCETLGLGTELGPNQNRHGISLVARSLRLSPNRVRSHAGDAAVVVEKLPRRLELGVVPR